MNQPPRSILSFSASQDEAGLVDEALRTTSRGLAVHHAADGADGLAVLRREGAYAGAQMPQLILLDLDLPGHNACDVLAEIRADSKFGAIPVVILAASESDPDIARAYQLFASACIVKPADRAAFRSVLAACSIFWLDVVKLPTRA